MCFEAFLPPIVGSQMFQDVPRSSRRRAPPRHLCPAPCGIFGPGRHLCGLRPSQFPWHQRPGGVKRPEKTTDHTGYVTTYKRRITTYERRITTYKRNLNESNMNHTWIMNLMDMKRTSDDLRNLWASGFIWLRRIMSVTIRVSVFPG